MCKLGAKAGVGLIIGRTSGANTMWHRKNIDSGIVK